MAAIVVHADVVRNHVSATFYPEEREVEVAIGDDVIASFTADDMADARDGLEVHFGRHFGGALASLLEVYDA